MSKTRSASMKSYWSDSVRSAHHREAIKIASQKPERRRKLGEAVRKAWQDQENKVKRKQAMKIAWDNMDSDKKKNRSQKLSESAKIAHAKRIIEGRGTWDNVSSARREQFRKTCSESTKKVWAEMPEEVALQRKSVKSWRIVLKHSNQRILVQSRWEESLYILLDSFGVLFRRARLHLNGATWRVDALIYDDLLIEVKGHLLAKKYFDEKTLPCLLDTPNVLHTYSVAILDYDITDRCCADFKQLLCSLAWIHVNDAYRPYQKRYYDAIEAVKGMMKF